jgi:hypothetical protein
MKKLFLILLAMVSIAINGAAELKETFDSNSWGWTERVMDEYKVYIVDGVLRFQIDTDTNVKFEELAEKFSSHAYLPIDPKKGFTITCDAVANKISDDKYFGVILDYHDDMNFMAFFMEKNWAYLCKIEKGRPVNQWKNQIHLPKQKKAKLDIKIEYQSGDLKIRVNDMPAIEARDIDIDYNGFGFFAVGDVKVDFDNVEIAD